MITVWEVGFKKGDTIEWEHNHIEDGYDPERKFPTAKFHGQHGWVNQLWRSSPAQLINGKVVYER